MANKSWIGEQTNFNVLQWDKIKEARYPESSAYLHDPEQYCNVFCKNSNYLDAAKLIAWDQYLRAPCQILDLGCGGGWLAGYLATLRSTDKIYALDTCQRMLSDMLPHVVKLLGGNPEKIVSIEALFTPLLFSDGSLDVVVASSSLHHANTLEDVLKEIRRVTKTNGMLFILNETPRSGLRYIGSITLAFAKMIIKMMVRSYEPSSPSISASGYLYDSYLGDKSYPQWYWEEAIRRSGFSIVEIMDTGLTPMKGLRGPSLTHFVCQAT